MPRFAANISMLFTELPFMDRFQAARDAGFDAVEYQFAYEFAPEALAHALKATMLQLVLHNLPPGNAEKGERGMACHPGRGAEFRVSVAEGIRYALAQGCPQLNCLAGIVPPGVSREAATECLVENLRYAAAELKRAGLRLLMEPINHFDIPGFLLNTTAQAAAIQDAVGSDNLFIQYDIYHAQRMEGELASTMQKNLNRIAHMQLADNPGRNEPGSGEINYAFLFRHIDAIGYQGYIGCEYKPATSTLAGLGWMQSLKP